MFQNSVVGLNSATTKGPRTITVNNNATGAKAINFTSITASPSQFAIDKPTTTCGATLAPNAECTVGVDFTATAPEKFSGVLTFTSNASDSPHSIALQGAGVAGLIDLSPTLVFLNAPVGYTSPMVKTATLSNPNTVALGVSNVFASGDFLVASDGCSTLVGGIPPAGNCKVTVSFTPSAQGQRTGNLTIISDASNSPARIKLQGTGTLSAPVLSATSLAFGKQKVGVPSAAMSVTAVNTNLIPIDFTAVTASSDYSVQSNTCTGSIPAGDYCIISVIFKPTITGSDNGTLSIVDNAGTGTPPTATQTILLYGTGD